MAISHKEYINPDGDNFDGWALNDNIDTSIDITTVGVVKLNNLTPSSVTQALIYDMSQATTDYSGVFQEIANLNFSSTDAEYKLVASVVDGLDPIDGLAANFVRWDITSAAFSADNLLLNLTHADGTGTNFVYSPITNAVNIYIRIYSNVATNTTTFQTVANQFDNDELFTMRITVFGEE